ncbi:MAG: aldehyde dehydrogenase family protein, partial [Bacteroidetes bacterium]|nr:aldehyde dehydrogenase family protein [Bacteroidota bacterium]
MVETITAEMLPNVIGGEHVMCSSGRSLPVTAPLTGEIIAEVPMSNAATLDQAVAAATEAQKEWAARPLKDRVQVFYKMKTIVEDELDHLIEVITRENGKMHDESKGSVLRAVECIEYAASLPQIASGRIQEVSKGVDCRTSRHPVGVVAGITPFNFPFMVPLWMVPMAIGLGNAFVLKPSEQTPLSAIEIARILKESGLPDGIFSVVNGDREIVEAICD